MKKFLPLQKAIALQESIGWLFNYKPNKEEDEVIGDSIEDKDIHPVFTSLLKELGEINKRREEIIKTFLINKK